MKYVHLFDDEIYEENDLVMVAFDNVDDDDLAKAFNDLFEERGFDWIWERLGDYIKEEIFNYAVEAYIEDYFRENDEEDEEEE